MEDTCRNGESTPGPDGSGDGDEDPSHVHSVFSSGSSEAREECTCDFCDGVEVEYSEIDAHSGEVEDHSFKKASQEERCPRCGGYNLNWRQRFIAHCASVGKRLGRKRRVFFVSFVLIRSAAEEAGLDTDESYEVLKSLWDRVRRDMKRRAEEVDYSGVLATRPSDHRYHGHLLVYASLTRYELMRAFHVRGLDTYIEPSDNTAATKRNDGRGPDDEGSSGGNDRDDWDARARFGMPKDEGMDAESFAAKKGAYIWENAAASKHSRYTSSRGNGAGYNSKEARRRRREAVNGQSDGNGDSTSDRDGDPAPSDPSPNRNGRGNGGGGGQDPGGSEGRNRGPNRGNRRSRAPPVDCGGEHFPDLDTALADAKAAFTKRVGTHVSLAGEGNAELLKVYRDEDRLTCVVVMDGEPTTTKVPWGQVDVVNPPTIRPGSSGATDRSNDRNTDGGGSDSDRDGGSSDSGSNGGSTPSENGDGGSDDDDSAPDNNGPDEDKDDPDEDNPDDDPDGDSANTDGPDGDDGSEENGSSDDDGDSRGDDGDGRKDDGSAKDDDPSERFKDAAEKSVVQTELPSQDRLKTVFDYETGKARASVLPPRRSTSD